MFIPLSLSKASGSLNSSVNALSTAYWKMVMSILLQLFFFFLMWRTLYMRANTKMAPRTHKSSRTNSHQPGWLVCTFCGLRDRMADQLLLGALFMWPVKFQGLSCLHDSWTTTAPDLLCGFVQTTSCLWASIISETPQLLRISYLISPWAILLSLSPKRDEVGLRRGKWRPSFCVGAVWAAVGVPFCFFFLPFL